MSEYHETVFVVSVEGDAWTVFGNLARLSNLCDLHLYTLGVGDGYAYIEGSYTDDEWEGIEKFCEDSGISICKEDQVTYAPYFILTERIDDEDEDEEEYE